MEDRQEGDDDHKTELIKSHIEEHFGSTQAADAFVSSTTHEICMFSVF